MSNSKTENTLYKIRASPDRLVITPGAEVTFTCLGSSQKNDIKWKNVDFQWFCLNNSQSIKTEEYLRSAENIEPEKIDRVAAIWSTYIKGPVGFAKYQWKNTQWSIEGTHKVFCIITDRAGFHGSKGGRIVCIYNITVGKLSSVIHEEFRDVKASPDPYAVYAKLETYIKILEDIHNNKNETYTGEAINLKDSQKETSKAQIDYYRQFKKRLGELIFYGPPPVSNRKLIYLRALHIAAKTQKRTELRIMLKPIPFYGHLKHYKLVDWTDPLIKVIPEIGGSGQDWPGALKTVLKSWKENNTYPPGKIEYQEPTIYGYPGVFDEKLWIFSTDGKSSRQEIVESVNNVALAASIAMLCLLPIPGSRGAAAAMWVAFFSGAMAAGVNISNRHAEGTSNWKASAIDILGVVGSMFGLRAWTRGAGLVMKLQNVKITQWVLYGEVGTAAVEGVLIAADEYENFNKIMTDDMTAEERVRRLGKFVAGAAGRTALIWLNLKGAKLDFENARLGRLSVEDLKNKELELNVDETPSIKSDTQCKTQVCTTQREYAIVTTKRKPLPHQTQKSWPEAKNYQERGLTVRQDQILQEVADRHDVIIVPRNSSEHARLYQGNSKYQPKPLQLKCKTLREGEYRGLAAAPPDDVGIIAMLKKDKMSYEEYVEKLAKDGYSVNKDKGYIIQKLEIGPQQTRYFPDSGAPVQGQNIEGFYSDLDLHGVYDAKTGRNAFQRVYGELNDNFRAILVQHPTHDMWTDKNNDLIAGVNWGPRGDSTAYRPHRPRARLDTWRDMESFYKENGIEWDKLYQFHYDKKNKK